MTRDKPEVRHTPELTAARVAVVTHRVIETTLTRTHVRPRVKAVEAHASPKPLDSKIETAFKPPSIEVTPHTEDEDKLKPVLDFTSEEIGVAPSTTAETAYIPEGELTLPAVVIEPQTIDLFEQFIVGARSQETPESEVQENEIAPAQEDEIAPTVEWADVLYKPPQEIFEDFTEALLVLAELPEVVPTGSEISAEDEDEISIAELVENDDATEMRQPVPSIVTEVAERLTELEPNQKEIVALMLKNIIGTLHGIQLLEARQADVEVEAQLEELCVTLFEALDLPYDQQKIKQFMRAIRRPKFQPQQQAKQAIDIEHMGTHEIKRRFRQITNGLLDSAESQLQHGLGVLALLWIRPANPTIAYIH